MTIGGNVSPDINGRSCMSGWRVAVLAFVIGSLSMLLVLELILRIAPLKRLPLVREITAENPLNRREASTKFSFSYGWRLENAHGAQTNAQGFVSGQDYQNGPIKIGIVGNSYIEASELLPGQHFAQLIGQMLPGSKSYSFGTAGAALSDYLMMAQWAEKHYQPEFLAALIVAGDVEKSLICKEGRTCFRPGNNGAIELQHRAWLPGPYYAWLNKSDLFGYVTRNLRFSPERLLDNQAGGKHSATESGANAEDYQRVVDAFLQQWPTISGHAPAKSILIFDADREAISLRRYGVADPLAETFKAKARQAGYLVVDMRAAFEEHRKRSRARLDFYPFDGHWSAVAHRMVAKSVVNVMNAPLIALPGEG